MIAIRTEKPHIVFPGYLLVVLLVLLASGCRNADPGEPDYDGGAFGDPYEIALNEHADVPPVLAGDTLSVRVAYAGGCTDHAFALDYTVAQDTSRLWLHHDANGDDCEAWIHEDVRLLVPPQVLEPSTIVLLNPHDSVPLVLRWGRP